MKLLRIAGSTSEIWQFFVSDTTSTTGAGLTGLTFNSNSISAYYHRDVDTTATAIALQTMTVGTYITGGFKEIDAVNMPGWYQFCPPDAALAAGAKSVAIHINPGTNNMAPLPIEVDLDAQVDLHKLKGGVIPAPTSTGIVDVNVINWNGTAVAAPNVAGVPLVDMTKILGTAVSAPATAGILDVNVKNIKNATTVGAAGYVGLDWAHITAPTTAVDLSGTTISPTQVVASVSGNVGGNVVGSVASVSGNLGGNVVGNVNGNVTGSVGSVVGSAGSIDGTTIGKIDAIKTKTDSLTFTAAGHVDANTLKVGGTTQTAGDIIADAVLIKAKTDNLPSDPADESLIIAATDAIVALIGTPVVDLATDISNSGGAVDLTPVTDQLTLVQARTDLIPDSPMATTDTVTLSSGERTTLAAVINTLVLDEAYPVPGQPITVTKALYAIVQQLGEQSITDGVMSVRKRDKATVVKTFTLNDPTSPTGITETT